MNLIDRATAVLRANDRGRYTVPAGHLYPHQWAWDSAFATIGWDWDRCARSVVAHPGADRSGGTFTVTGGNASFEVDVALSRVLPTISCRAAGGLPAKESSEWKVTAVRRLATVG